MNGGSNEKDIVNCSYHDYGSSCNWKRLSTFGEMLILSNNKKNIMEPIPNVKRYINRDRINGVSRSKKHYTEASS